MRSTGSVILEEGAKYKEVDQSLMGTISEISEIGSGNWRPICLGDRLEPLAL